MAIHGGFSQAKRTKTMEDFHSKNIKVLVCTDVAARGLDIKGVSHIYNYDIPADDKSYIHRIGRTARAGKEGKAISLLCNKDYDNFRRALDNKKFNIQRLELPNIERASIRFKGGRIDRDRPRRNFRSGSHSRPSPREGFGRGFRRPGTGQRFDNSRKRFHSNRSGLGDRHNQNRAWHKKHR
jgi:ATP-dependent RNA helicase DeaD